MRILHVGKYYHPVRGGMETVLRSLCEGLLSRGHAVTALVAGTHPLDRVETLRTPAGGATGRLVRAGRVGIVASQPLTPTLPILIRRELRRLRPDLVQLHLPNPLAATSWLMTSRGGDATPLVIWYHADITRQRFGGRCVTPVVRACLGQSQGIAVSSPELAATSPLLTAFREKVTVIPFGIDVNDWSRENDLGTGPQLGGGSKIIGREGVSLPPADAPFLFVGRLVGYKGLDLLCEAVGSLPGARLEIVGDGPLRKELAALISRSGWSRRIAMLGEVDDTTLRARLQGCRALVLPSRDRSETFGLVQLEAMAAGKPVVATRLPTGASSVAVDGETGRLVPPGDGEALRSVLAELLSHPERGVAWGAAGRRRAREHFTAESMVERLIAWYLDVLAAARPVTNPGAP
jgi:rhamnosyl/mannosyltransferase